MTTTKEDKQNVPSRVATTAAELVRIGKESAYRSEATALEATVVSHGGGEYLIEFPDGSRALGGKGGLWSQIRMPDERGILVRSSKEFKLNNALLQPYFK